MVVMSPHPRNPGIKFTEASIRSPTNAGLYDLGIHWTLYQICARWKGIDLAGKEITKYTVSWFSNGNPVGSRESSSDT